MTMCACGFFPMKPDWNQFCSFSLTCAPPRQGFRARSSSETRKVARLSMSHGGKMRDTDPLFSKAHSVVRPSSPSELKVPVRLRALAFQGPRNLRGHGFGISWVGQRRSYYESE